EQVHVGEGPVGVELSSRRTGDDLDNQHGAPDRRHRMRGVDLDDIARLHPLTHDGQSDPSRLELDRRSAAFLGHRHRRELTHGEERLAAHQHVDHRAFLGDDPVQGKDVVTHFELQSLGGCRARHRRLANERGDHPDSRTSLRLNTNGHANHKSDQHHQPNRTPCGHGYLRSLKGASPECVSLNAGDFMVRSSNASANGRCGLTHRKDWAVLWMTVPVTLSVTTKGRACAGEWSARLSTSWVRGSERRPMSSVETVEDPEDPRIADYRQIRDAWPWANVVSSRRRKLFSPKRTLTASWCSRVSATRAMSARSSAMPSPSGRAPPCSRPVRRTRSIARPSGSRRAQRWCFPSRGSP